MARYKYIDTNPRFLAVDLATDYRLYLSETRDTADSNAGVFTRKGVI